MAQYKLHIFKTSNTFSVTGLTGTAADDTIEYLAIGGGGGGGAGLAGGGGAGGFLASNLQLASSGEYVIEIGGGGAGEPNTNGGTGRGATGGNTYINLNGSNLFIALGGGGGGTQNYAPPPSFSDGLAGGSGGGSGGKNGNGTAGAAIGFPGPSAQGNPGGTGSYPGSGGGGGGAGAAGGNGAPAPRAGGAGLSTSWVPSDYGTTGPAPGRYFSGGGGGGSGGAGGVGGGGAAAPGGGPAATAGTINTGGGGGGGYNTYPTPPYQRAGAPGGSGILIVKYPYFTPNITYKVSRVISSLPNVSGIYANEIVTFDVNTINAANNETLYYSTAGEVSNFIGANTGSFVLTGNTSIISLRPSTVESNSLLRLQIRRNSVSGTILKESSNILVVPNFVDVYTTSLSNAFIYETEAATFGITTVNASGNAGGTLYYTVTGNADIFSSSSGSIIINDNVANLELIAEASVEPNEVKAFAVQLRSANTSGIILKTTETCYVSSVAANAVVNSRISRVANVTSQVSDIFAEDNVTFTVNTIDAANATTLYYDTLGNVTSASFLSGNTGSFVVNGNTAVITLTSDISSINQVFSLQVRRGSSSGAILGKSDNITIKERLITGGTIEDDGTYITHIFTETSNLVISPSLSVDVLSNVLVVAGGGGAGNSSPGYHDGGGGGGGGGLIDHPGVTLYAGNTYLISVGAGGGQFTQGTPSTAFDLVALGGGGGKGPGFSPYTGTPGGSGGGGGRSGGGGAGIQTTEPTIPADSRTYGFGNNGGSAQPGNGRGGGGGSAAGAGAILSGANGKPIGWVPSSVGVAGPESGRYFSGGAAGFYWLAYNPAHSTGFPQIAAGLTRSNSFGGATAGDQNTGGGGGTTSGGPAGPGKAGGSGVVVIRYLKSDVT